RLRGTRHDARNPRRLGRGAPEGARVRDPGDPQEEGRGEEARPEDRRGLLQVARRQAAVIFALTLLTLAALPQSPAVVKWDPPHGAFIEGTPFVARITIQAPKEGATIDSWMLEPSAFTIDGKPLAERGEAHVVK